MHCQSQAVVPKIPRVEESCVEEEMQGVSESDLEEEERRTLTPTEVSEVFGIAESITC